MTTFPSPFRSPRALIALCLAITACGEPSARAEGSVGGTVVFSIPGEAEHLMPPVILTIAAKQIADQVFAPLAEAGATSGTLGDAGFVPRAAARWSWSPDSGAIDFHLRPNGRFHDGHPVTAADVKFSYELFADPAVASPHFSAFPDIDSLTVVDSMTLRVFFGDRTPERFFKFATNLVVLPKHLLEGLPRNGLAASAPAQAPVGSGPYRFVKWERGTALELAADTTNAEGRPTLDRLVWRPATDPNAATRTVVAGEADFTENVRPEGMAMITPDGPARTTEYAAPMVGYLLFNTRAQTNRQQPHPALGDRAVRRALAQAIDRAAAVRNALDSLAVLARGPLPRTSWAHDTTITSLAFDLAAARSALDAAGWVLAPGDSVRSRQGARLRLSLLVPSVSATRRQMATVVTDQLRAVGVEVSVEVLEPSVLLPRLNAGKFDAFIHVWQSDASPSTMVQAWGSADLGRSQNYGWYSNPTVDSLLGQAIIAPTVAAARPLYSAASKVIVADAPAVFLWEPRSFALAHTRIKFTSLRPEAWWSGIRGWTIPAAERLPRDEVGR
jgi:peptide/nickel transport system substrate-binding protein